MWSCRTAVCAVLAHLCCSCLQEEEEERAVLQHGEVEHCSDLHHSHHCRTHHCPSHSLPPGLDHSLESRTRHTSTSQYCALLPAACCLVMFRLAVLRAVWLSGCPTGCWLSVLHQYYYSPNSGQHGAAMTTAAVHASGHSSHSSERRCTAATALPAPRASPAPLAAPHSG